jgi:hypothetical protein
MMMNSSPNVSIPGWKLGDRLVSKLKNLDTLKSI